MRTRSPRNLNSCGRRTAWLRPLRNSFATPASGTLNCYLLIYTMSIYQEATRRWPTLRSWHATTSSPSPPPSDGEDRRESARVGGEGGQSRWPRRRHRAGRRAHRRDRPEVMTAAIAARRRYALGLVGAASRPNGRDDDGSFGGIHEVDDSPRANAQAPPQVRSLQPLHIPGGQPIDRGQQAVLVSPGKTFQLLGGARLNDDPPGSTAQRPRPLFGRRSSSGTKSP